MDKATVQDLVAWCSDKDGTDANKRCLAMLGMEMWLLSSAPEAGMKLCLPTEHRLENAQNAVVKWFKGHPEMMNRPAADALSDAMIAIYKCG